MLTDTAFHAFLHSLDSSDATALSPASGANSSREIVFIDESFYPTSEQLAAGLFASEPSVSGPSASEPSLAARIEPLMLDSERNGIYQISDALIDRSQITDLHVVVLGVPGQIQLGNSILSLDTIDLYRHEFPIWQTALADNAEIWIHCDAIDQDDRSQGFTQRLSELTQRMVYFTNRRL